MLSSLCALMCFIPIIVPTSAHACHPKVVYVSDIHEPTLLNAAFNVQLNAGRDKIASTYYDV